MQPSILLSYLALVADCGIPPTKLPLRESPFLVGVRTDFGLRCLYDFSEPIHFIIVVAYFLTVGLGLLSFHCLARQDLVAIRALAQKPCS